MSRTGACGSSSREVKAAKPAHAKSRLGAAPVDATATVAVPKPPGASLILAEREVWALEGLLVAEAELALRSPKAKQALGEPGQLRYSDSAEARVRTYLRNNRSPEVRARATAFLALANRPTRSMLVQVAQQANLKPEDVFLDYLTYDGLFDLAIMRYGYKRWKAGGYAGADKALADSFFSLMPAAPSAELGIKVISSDDSAIEISVFGGRVVSKVSTRQTCCRDAHVVGLHRVRAVAERHRPR